MKKFEITLVAIASLMALIWFFNPNGNFEPVIVFLTLAALLVSKAFNWNKKEVVTNSFYKDLPQNRLSARANKVWNDFLRLLRIKSSQMKFLPSSESAVFLMNVSL